MKSSLFSSVVHGGRTLAKEGFLPNLSSFLVLFLLHRALSFLIRNERPTRKTNHMHTTDPVHSINNTYDRIVNNKPLIPDTPFHPGPVLGPTRKQKVTYDQSSQKYKILTLILILILKKTHHFKKVSYLKHFKGKTNYSFKILKN